MASWPIQNRHLDRSRRALIERHSRKYKEKGKQAAFMTDATVILEIKSRWQLDYVQRAIWKMRLGMAQLRTKLQIGRAHV